MENYNDDFDVQVADASHEIYIDTFLHHLAQAARVRSAGIAMRTHEYVAAKMRERKAVIALHGDEFAGFCYLESWENKQYVALSGLLVAPRFRGRHLATRIKRTAFALCRTRWPHARIFALTSSPAVVHINADLGYVSVPFDELTHDDVFWKSCGTPQDPGCINCDVLAKTGRRFCVCTGMLFDPERHRDEPLPVALPQEVVDFVRRAEEGESAGAEG